MESELCGWLPMHPPDADSVRRPITIKKCQDDQGFDVTQTEIIGSLFTSAATIRVIQASPTVNIRDSVPPDSALRYDPALSSNHRRRRRRESSVQANGGQSPASGSNKRRKLSDIDPDTPMQSCERDLGGSQEERNATTIPDSQQSSGRLGFRRGEIPDTVSPPHPALLHCMNNEKRQTDQLRYKPATANRTGALPTATQGSPSRSAGPSSAPAKSKSASYHIERATGRGTTAATSPLSVDQQGPPRNRPILPNKTTLSGPARTNGKPSPKDHTIYDVDEIDSESANSSAILVKTKASLKDTRSPMNGVSPQERANKFNTPPTRRSRSGDQASAPELPLTPRSKQREEKQQRQLEVADKSRNTAAEAAERRIREESEQKNREAEEAGKAERAKAAEVARLKKEEQERLAAEKRAAVGATAARLEKERVEKIQRDRKAEEKRLAEQKRSEQARLKKAKEQAEKLEQERKARIVQQKKEEERRRREEAKLAADAEAERLRKEEEERKRFAEVAAAEELRKSKEKAQAETQTQKRKLSSASVESSRSGSRPGPSPVPRPQSSTPFIPNGRKSALKSSQAGLTSSPIPRQSPSDASISSSQAGPMYEGQRRVSFNLEATPIEFPIKGRRPSILATDAPPKKQPRTPILPPEKQSHTPILPPASIFAKDRTITPVLPPKKITSSITPPASITPRVTLKSASPIPTPIPKNSKTPRSSATKGMWTLLSQSPHFISHCTYPIAHTTSLIHFGSYSLTRQQASLKLRKPPQYLILQRTSHQRSRIRR